MIAPLDEVRAELESRGLNRLVLFLPRLLHPFVRVLAQDVSDSSYEDRYLRFVDPTPVGISKIGGWPDVWPGFEWPQCGEWSLPLLAQFRLEDVAPFDEEHVLSRSGMLLVFYDFMAHMMGEKSVAARDFDGELSQLRRAEIPGNAMKWELLAENEQLAYESPLPVRFCRDWQLADDDTLEFQSIRDSLIALGEEELSAVELEKYWRFSLDWNSARCVAVYKRELGRRLRPQEEPYHQLLGVPYVGNCDGRLDAVCQSRDFPDTTLIASDQEAQMFAEAPNWRLLFQLSSDDGLQWGDNDKILFFIENDALKRGDFSDVQVTHDG